MIYFILVIVKSENCAVKLRSAPVLRAIKALNHLF